MVAVDRGTALAKLPCIRVGFRVLCIVSGISERKFPLRHRVLDIGLRVRGKRDEEKPFCSFSRMRRSTNKVAPSSR